MLIQTVIVQLRKLQYPGRRQLATNTQFLSRRVKLESGLLTPSTTYRTSSDSRRYRIRQMDARRKTPCYLHPTYFEFVQCIGISG